MGALCCSEVAEQPSVHSTDLVLQQREVPLGFAEGGFGTGYVFGQPLAVLEGDEPIVASVQDLHWDAD